jgi:hypothetical protein
LAALTPVTGLSNVTVKGEWERAGGADAPETPKTCSLKTGEVAAGTAVSPEYAAVMEWLPIAPGAVVQVAVPDALRLRVWQPAMDFPPTLNDTLPPPSVSVTVAVYVTLVTGDTGFCAEVSATPVTAWLTPVEVDPANVPLPE